MGLTGAPPADLPAPLPPEQLASAWRDKTLPDVCREALEQVERRYLDMVLTETGGRVGLTARRAGIHARGLYEKMKKYHLNKADYRRK